MVSILSSSPVCSPISTIFTTMASHIFDSFSGLAILSPSRMLSCILFTALLIATFPVTFLTLFRASRIGTPLDIRVARVLANLETTDLFISLPNTGILNFSLSIINLHISIFPINLNIMKTATGIPKIEYQ